METIAGVPVEKIYYTITENYIQAGIISERERLKMREVLAELSQQDLLTALFDSRYLAAQANAEKEMHIAERLN